MTQRVRAGAFYTNGVCAQDHTNIRPYKVHHNKYILLSNKWNLLSAEVPAAAGAVPDIDVRLVNGYLMYAVRTRPEIGYAVNARETVTTPFKTIPKAPTPAFKYAIWTTLRYLVSTRTLELTFLKFGGFTPDAGYDR